jgi:hypothetical protein
MTLFPYTTLFRSKLGPSYSFWIPWDADGPDGNVKKVSLIVRYAPKVGSSVVSSQALAYLPGKAGQSELQAKAEWDARSSFEGSIQEAALLAKKESAVRTTIIESNDRSNALQMTTIGVPTALAQNLRNLPPQTAPPQVAPPPMILPAGYVLPTENVTEKEQEPKLLTKPDLMGRGPHALDVRKPAERPAP